MPQVVEATDQEAALSPVGTGVPTCSPVVPRLRTVTTCRDAVPTSRLPASSRQSVLSTAAYGTAERNLTSPPAEEPSGHLSRNDAAKEVTEPSASTRASCTCTRPAWS